MNLLCVFVPQMVVVVTQHFSYNKIAVYVGRSMYDVFCYLCVLGERDTVVYKLRVTIEGRLGRASFSLPFML